MRELIVHRGGFGMSIQDLGRASLLNAGLSRGGAMDRLALFEGAALLGQSPGHAALEMTAAGGEFEATADMHIALTGAPMNAKIDGQSVQWSASHTLPKGARLTITGGPRGVYGYLHVGGGFATELELGSRSAHLLARIGKPVENGTRLPCGIDTAEDNVSQVLTPHARFEGGEVRVLATPQTELFTQEALERFSSQPLQRDQRGNRMGVRFLGEGTGFAPSTGLSILSQTVVPGDIQIAGDGMPFVLLSECQTTGGYPRIGTVIPSDIPIVAQTPPMARLNFQFITYAKAHEIEAKARAKWLSLPQTVAPLFRNPRDIPDLLSYQLISGMSAGDELE